MKPFIGLIPLYDENKESYWMLPGYMKLIEDCGGVPVMLPLTDNSSELEVLLEKCDGFLLTGGNDLDPKNYGEENSGKCGYICSERDSMEFKLMKRAVQQDKAILGICRGHQLINVFFGGSLYQDIPIEHPSDIVHHMDAPYDRAQHTVNISRDSILFDVLGVEHYAVNSCHHQGIKALAPGLQAIATADDGMIEAVCMPDKKFIVGVQWHPEFFYNNEFGSVKIIDSFVKACDTIQ